jgi:leucyl-tRNA synthetase
MVCKETLSCSQHGFLLPDEIKDDGEMRRCIKCDRQVTVGRIEKMSKSKKNVVDPNILLDKYGADTTRLFCLFAAPPERDLEWSEQGVDGGYRFLNRVWRFYADWVQRVAPAEPYSGSPESLDGAVKELYRKTHQTIAKVTSDIEERFHFNTAISAIMEMFNQMSAFNPDDAMEDTLMVMRSAMDNMVLLLSPIVPHFAEELWRALGNTASLLELSWPAASDAALEKEELLIVVQVNGKLRSRFSVSAETDDETIKETALADERIQKFIDDKPIKKVILVKNKLVNIVV